ncbi:MAG: hypothetical protein Wins2KO_31840 [Winogradskyella sp.]
MEERILDKTLKQLEGLKQTKKIEFKSYVLEKSSELLNKKLKHYNNEDLRLMISQNCGLKYLVPLAVNILKINPLVEANFYEGDLLFAILSVDENFWNEYPNLKEEIIQLFTKGEIDYELLTNSIKSKIYTAFEEFTE